MAVALTTLPVKLQYPVAEPSAQQDLLEALLASCQKPALSAPLPGFGRALQPYFGPNETTYPSKIGSRNKYAYSLTSLRKVVQFLHVSNLKSFCRNSPAPNSQVPKNPKKNVLIGGSTAKRVTDARSSTRKNQAVSFTTLEPKSEADALRAAQLATTILTSWAGPGFCNAPPPDKLPKPPLSLLD